MHKNGNRLQKSYSDDERAALLKRMFPPENITISNLSRETGISKSTLATWKSKASNTGANKKITLKANKNLSSREKFLIVIETYSMPEVKLSEYCRSKGLYVEEVKKWREVCITANGKENEISKEFKDEIQQDKKKIKLLEKEVNRKDKALAETAALLVLRKKLGAILGDQEEE